VVYLIAEQGNFILKTAPILAGARAPRGSVLTLVVDASAGHITDVGASNRYPRLAALGPVTTDLGWSRSLGHGAASPSAHATPIATPPPHCRFLGGPSYWAYIPSALRACGLKVYPLLRVKRLPGSGHAYIYGDGTTWFRRRALTP
jgi:hypothetical protein